MPHPVVIVGGGLAGLAAGQALYERKIPFQLIEASDRVGGRLATDFVDGFRLDRGFQVHFDAYPYAQQLIDQESLNLRSFRAGADIFDGTRLHRIDRDLPLMMALNPVWSMGDKLRLLRWSLKAKSVEILKIRTDPDSSAMDRLKSYGFSTTFIDGFARPFFGGIFLDPKLEVSSRQLEFVFKMISSGHVTIPAAGIEAIPKSMAAKLPKSSIRLNTKVTELVRNSEGRVTGVHLDTFEALEARAVILATAAPAAATLSGEPLLAGQKSSATLYFETTKPVVPGAYLVLNGSGKGILNEVAPLTNAAPSYAPPGRHLISCTVLGLPTLSESDLVDTVRRELERWFPHLESYMFRHIRTYVIPYAQMPQVPYFRKQLQDPQSHQPGLYFAGEFTTNSSIDGALESGLRAVQAFFKGGGQ